MDFPAKIISSICFRLEADRKIAEHQIHELQARLDEVEANALKNGKKAAAKLETRFVYLTNLNFAQGVVHKLRLQEEVGRWSKNVHFLSK